MVENKDASDLKVSSSTQQKLPFKPKPKSVLPTLVLKKHDGVPENGDSGESKPSKSKSSNAERTSVTSPLSPSKRLPTSAKESSGFFNELSVTTSESKLKKRPHPSPIASDGGPTSPPSRATPVGSPPPVVSRGTPVGSPDVVASSSVRSSGGSDSSVKITSIVSHKSKSSPLSPRPSIHKSPPKNASSIQAVTNGERATSSSHTSPKQYTPPRKELSSITATKSHHTTTKSPRTVEKHRQRIQAAKMKPKEVICLDESSDEDDAPLAVIKDPSKKETIKNRLPSPPGIAYAGSSSEEESLASLKKRSPRKPTASSSDGLNSEQRASLEAERARQEASRRKHKKKKDAASEQQQPQVGAPRIKHQQQQQQRSMMEYMQAHRAPPPHSIRPPYMPPHGPATNMMPPPHVQQHHGMPPGSHILPPGGGQSPYGHSHGGGGQPPYGHSRTRLTSPTLVQPPSQKKLLISIDMKPEEWNKLSKDQQAVIIERKKAQARQQLQVMATQQHQPQHQQQRQQLLQQHQQQQRQQLLQPQHFTGVRPAGIYPMQSAPGPYYTGQQPLPSSAMFQHFQRKDDLDLENLQPLPAAKPIPLPEGFPAEHFGDVIMIVNFVDIFREFLQPEDERVITMYSMMESLVGGSEHAHVVANILLLFLKVLLSHEKYKIQDLGIELADLPLTEHTISYLLFMYLKSGQLRREKQKDAPTDMNTPREIDRIIQHLDGNEFHSLQCKDQMEVLMMLHGMLLESEELAEYFEDMATEKMDLVKEQYELRVKATEMTIKLHEQMKLQNVEPPSSANTIDKFVTKSESGDTSSGRDSPSVPTSTDNKENTGDEKVLSSPVDCSLTQRQLSAKRAEVEERERKKLQLAAAKEQEKLDKIQREIDQLKKRDDDIEKKMQGLTLRFKRSQRLQPLGMDRYHRLYWLFSSDNNPVTAGLYVEDGWRQDQPIPEPDSWCYYDNVADIEKLIGALTTRGVREEKLKVALRSNLKAIKKSIEVLNKDKVIDVDEEETDSKDGMQAIIVEDNSENVPGSKPETPKIYSQDKYDTIENNDEKVGESVENDAVKVETTDVITENDIAQMLVDSSANISAKLAKETSGEDAQKADASESVACLTEEAREKTVDKDEKEKASDLAIDVEEAPVLTEQMDVDDKVPESESTNSSTLSEEAKDTITGIDVAKENVNNDVLSVTEVNGNASSASEDNVATSSTMEVDDDASTEDKSTAEVNDGNAKSATEVSADALVSTTEVDEQADVTEKKVDTSTPEVNEDTLASTEGDKPTDVAEKKVDASMQAIIEDMMETSKRIVCGALGVMKDELSAWLEDVRSARSLEKLISHVLSLQASIKPKFLQGALDASNAKEGVLEEWREAVTSVKTMSALHTMYGILENCIKWEQTTEHTRCKTCRRSESRKAQGSAVDDHVDILIRCDTCGNGYHQYCLRPAMVTLPEGQWRCPMCVPLEERSGRRGKKTYTEPEAVDSDHDENCHVCDTGGELILCDSCPLSFHLLCHTPPLRCVPKGNWTCCECRKPGKKGKKWDSDDDVDSDADSEEEVVSRSARGRVVKTNARGKKQVEVSDDEEEESEDEEEEPPAKTSRAKNARKATNAKKKSKKEKQDTDEDDDDDEEVEAPKNSRSKNAKKAAPAKTNNKSRKKAKVAKGSESEEEEEEVITAHRSSRAQKSNNKKVAAKKNSRKPAASKRKKKDDTEDEDEDEEVATEEEEQDDDEVEVVEDDDNEEENSDETETKSKATKTSRNKKAKDAEKKSKVSRFYASTSKNNSDADSSGVDSSKGRRAKTKRQKVIAVENDDDEEDEEEEVVSPVLGNRRPRYNKDTQSSKPTNSRKRKRIIDVANDEEDNSEKETEEKTPRSAARPDEGSSLDTSPTELRGRDSRKAKRNKRGNNYELNACSEVLLGLQHNEDSWPFLHPVDLKKVPDYMTVVEKAMDFDTIQSKLESMEYEDALQFIQDVQLVFENCKLYNKQGEDIYSCGEKVDAHFKELLKNILPELAAMLKSD